MISGKGSRLILPVLLVFVISLLMAGCGGASKETQSTQGDSQKKKVKRISIATAGTGGAWYPIGGAFANVITQKAEGFEVTAETSAASIESIRKMKNGDLDMGMLIGDVTWEAYAGKGQYQNAKVDILRSLFAINAFKYHVVALKKSPINKLEEIKGKRVGVGAAGSGNENTVKQLLKAYGITYNDIEEQFLSTTESVTAIRDGNMDVFLAGMSVPSGTIMDLANTHEIKFIPLEGPSIDKFISESPFYFKTTIPNGSYKGQDNEVATIATTGFVTATTRLSEDEVYRIMKAIWDNRDTWVTVHNEAKLIVMDKAIEGLSIPLHPGAVKFYKEKGMQIPDKLLPLAAK